MSKPVLALGVALILMSVWMAVSPEQFLSVVDWESRRGLYIAAGIRVVAGLVLVLTASATRYPRGLRILGALVLLAGLSLPFLPLHLWAGLIRWFLQEASAAFWVGGGVVGIFLGAFLVFAALPKRGAKS